MIALYLRLSVSDGDLGVDNKDVSNSIENQEQLLRNYLEDHPEITGEVKTFVDDGYTGTNFNRPSFREMIDKCRKGIVSTIIVKDLSRLGRNYIEVGDYVDQLFPMLGIRFISVTQKYDSKDFNGLGMDFGMQINNLVASLYSRDMSRKQKSTRQTKRKQGISMSGVAPFGYIKDTERKGRFKIDPEASEIVKTIYKKAIEGYGLKGIVEYLNDEHIPTPMEYNREKQLWKNMNSCKTTESECLWDVAKVRNIIQKYEYTGAFVAGMRTPVTIGSSNVRLKPRNEWTIIDGLNEPIVSLEEYELAQRVIKSRGKVDYKVEKKYTLKGKVKCGTCRLNMVYADAVQDEYYYCNHKKSAGSHSQCCDDKFYEDHLENVVYSSLKNICKILRKEGTEAELRNAEYRKSFSENNLENIDKKIQDIQNEKFRLYESYADGRTKKEIYKFKKDNLSSQLSQLVKEKDRIQQEFILKNKEFMELKETTDMAELFLGTNKLTRELVEYFIKTVYVYDNSHIEIVFNFKDEIRKIITEAEHERNN